MAKVTLEVAANDTLPALLEVTFIQWLGGQALTELHKVAPAASSSFVSTTDSTSYGKYPLFIPVEGILLAGTHVFW